MKKLFAAFAMLALFVPALAFGQNLVTDAKLGRNVVDRELTEEATLLDATLLATDELLVVVLAA